MGKVLGGEKVGRWGGGEGGRVENVESKTPCKQLARGVVIMSVFDFLVDHL